jgi:hypothetical protein
MGESARERVEAGFDWADYGSRALRAYARAVASKAQAADRRGATGGESERAA